MQGLLARIEEDAVLAEEVRPSWGGLQNPAPVNMYFENKQTKKSHKTNKKTKNSKESHWEKERNKQTKEKLTSVEVQMLASLQQPNSQTWQRGGRQRRMKIEVPDEDYDDDDDGGDGDPGDDFAGDGDDLTQPTW